MMLDPLREEGLHTSALISRLKLPADAVVADVGAGPGFLTLPLARAVPQGRVIATDVKLDYLAIAQSRARQAGLSNVETRVTPADDAQLHDGEVDLALLCQVDQLLPDRARYFRRLTVALKPQGRIALVNWARFRDADLAAAREAGLRVVDEWTPTPPFFALVLERS